MIGSKRSIRSVAAIALVLVAAAVSMVVAQEGRDAAGNRRPVNTTLITLEFWGFWASGRLDVASDGTCALQTPSRGWPGFPGVLGGFPAVLDAMPRPCVVPPRLFARLRAAVSAVRWRSLRADYPGLATAGDGNAYHITHEGRSIGVSTWLEDLAVPRELARVIDLLDSIHWKLRMAEFA